MRLAPLFSRFAGLLFAAAAAAAAMAPLEAMGEVAKARILIVGSEAGAGLGAGLPAAGAVVVLDALPTKGGVDAAFFGARLKARPVSTLPDPRPVEVGPVEEFFLVVRATLGDADGADRLSIADDVLTVPAFGARLGLTADAFDARHRRVAFVEIADPDDAFPAAMAAIRGALEPLGFDMLVLEIKPGEAQTCTGGQRLHLSIASGLADRVPFGDGNGATTMAEAESYLTDALRRGSARGCGAAYSLILKAVDDAGRVVVAHPLAPFAEVEDRLDREIFEAMFLGGSDNAAALGDFLGACTYCPSEAPLSARLKSMSARARISALEDEMWAEIKDDSHRGRLAIYVDHCRLCNHSDEALTRIERLDEEEAARQRERRAFTVARDGRDLAGLRSYVGTCRSCAHGDEARALIAELEADTAYRAERRLLADALAGQAPMKLQAYLGQCAVCDGAEDARAMLDRLAALETLRAPCLAVAGLPQMGGPRKLEDIDQAEARKTCSEAAEAFPDDGLLQVVLGRVAQATGDVAVARQAYAVGTDREVPAAFGLAAYAEYAPADGGPIDPLRVEALALEGAAKGDWLSQEVLTVLYSKNLVPGKSGKEAFDTAMNIAREGDPLAQFFVGHYYLNGVGAEVSEKQAAQWLQKAVDAGYTHANSYLAELHERGTDGGAQPQLAAELFWTALQQGDATARDQLTTALASRSAEVVRIIQGKLREQGLYQGAVDGVPGPGTAAAIRAYANSVAGQG